MPFNIIQGDITTLAVDAIVNAANNYLSQGGGVCGAIFSAAGANKLQTACDAIGYCPTGQAVITKGFKLKAKYIIHTVGPIYGIDTNAEEQLYSCYYSSLELARENKLNSIAFPLISSGIFGYPPREAFKVAQTAIRHFLSNNDMDIFLIIDDKSSFRMNEELYEHIQTYILKSSIPHEQILYSHACYGGALKSPKSDIKELLFDDSYETFSEMLFRLIDQKGYTDVEVYKRANIDRKLFSKMRKKDYIPKKSTVMALIIALRLDMDEAKDLLCEAGFAFSHSSKSDVIIQYFIENKNYDIFEINEALFAFDQPLLGA